MKRIIKKVNFEDMFFLFIFLICFILLVLGRIKLTLVATIISVINIIYTIINKKRILIYEKELDYKRNTEKFFMEIYFEDLTIRIPYLLDHLSRPIGEESAERANELADLVSNLRHKIKFYKIFNKKYYSEISKKLCNIEDFILDEYINIGLEKKRFKDYERQEVAIDKLNSKIQDLYETIFEYHI